VLYVAASGHQGHHPDGVIGDRSGDRNEGRDLAKSSRLGDETLHPTY
jgi:hypothetical protein